MFELGWIEIGIIGVIALVVLGPERLPKAARFVGLWVRKARGQWFAVKAEMERELAAEDLKAALLAERQMIREAVQQIDAEASSIRSTLDDEAKAMGSTLDDAPKDSALLPLPPATPGVASVAAADGSVDAPRPPSP